MDSEEEIQRRIREHERETAAREAVRNERNVVKHRKEETSGSRFEDGVTAFVVGLVAGAAITFFSGAAVGSSGIVVIMLVAYAFLRVRRESTGRKVFVEPELPRNSIDDANDPIDPGYGWVQTGIEVANRIREERPDLGEPRSSNGGDIIATACHGWRPGLHEIPRTEVSMREARDLTRSYLKGQITLATLLPQIFGDRVPRTFDSN